jgi:hypothetical protein
MTHADPWDETSRLEKQVEAELLAELEISGLPARGDGALIVPPATRRPSDT